MTPKSPALAARIGTWTPAELFSIVKHGIKFTGMPAWPALQRDDEVWAMVAFLRALPDLDSAEYLRLVNGDTPAMMTTPPIEGLAGATNDLRHQGAAENEVACQRVRRQTRSGGLSA